MGTSRAAFAVLFAPFLAASLSGCGPIGAGIAALIATGDDDGGGGPPAVAPRWRKAFDAAESARVGFRMRLGWAGRARTAAGIVVLLASVADASAVPALLTGTRLVLTDSAQKPRRRALKVVSRDPAIAIDAGSAGDPVLHGATLRVAAAGDLGFDTRYLLPAGGWSYIGARAGRRRGYRFRGDGPIARLVVRPGQLLRIVGRGAGLGHRLGLDPGAVDVVLRLGAHRVCLHFGGSRTYRPGKAFVAREAAAARCRLNDAWMTHAIDDRFRGANGLHGGDVDGDGRTDYLTNYEFDQRFVVTLRPPPPLVRRRWPAVIAWQPTPLAAGAGVNPESSALADVDGDGQLDVVSAQGWSALPDFEGSEAGVRVVWGPAPGDVLDPGAWIDAGRIPTTIDRGHYLWVRPFDVNGDGATDLLAGGRRHAGNGAKTGPQWIEAPADPLLRRDLARWTVHDIDPDQIDGHGFVLADVDQDGDDDLVDANADFDTPESDETVHWYENPGPGSPAQRAPWTKHVIYQGAEFDPKPQVAVLDLDGDGLTDVLTQVESAVYWFRKTALAPVAFEHLVIPKDPRAQFFARPLRVADLDGDGRLDLLGMLAHRTGDIPRTKMSVFWMRYEGPGPVGAVWSTSPIRWGSEKTMAIAIERGFAEKWDQVDVVDLDDDGDLDIVANCEEWWETGGLFEASPFYTPGLNPSSVSVVWFENRLHDDPFLAEERAGVAAIEAEHFARLDDGSWIERNRYPGHVGDGYVQVHVARADPARAADATLGLGYQVAVTGGTYRLWVRRWVPSTWGYGLGGLRSDSAWIAANDDAFAVLDDGGGATDGWEWVPAPAPLVLPAGTHTLRLRARENGYAIDRLLLVRDPAFVPQGDGPAETLVP